ncbi:MAG: hypothetical protein HY926_13655 [Elusimicrobia bacterium]|nr:hypothetical protein [Elusimicrobiota bacterium]
MASLSATAAAALLGTGLSAPVVRAPLAAPGLAPAGLMSAPRLSALASPILPTAPPVVAPAAPLASLETLTGQLLAPQAAPAQVLDRFFTAADFGAKNGTEISNKDTVLGEVDRSLGRKAPPALEYIFVKPLATLRLDRGSGTGTNPYGHAVVRYTMPDGTQKVMNIVGAKGRQLVNFLKPEDYLYGTGVFDSGSEQGGVYNRGMVSVRIEELPAEQLLALDRYYTELAARAQAGEAAFKLLIGRVLNLAARALRLSWPEFGNCALWTSKGLAAAGILDKPTPWPKHILVDLLEKYRAQDPGNVHVVSYHRIAHAVQTYGKPAETHGLVAPLHLLKTIKYWDLERFADAKVEVPEGSMTARAGVPGPSRGAPVPGT